MQQVCRRGFENNFSTYTYAEFGASKKGSMAKDIDAQSRTYQHKSPSQSFRRCLHRSRYMLISTNPSDTKCVFHGMLRARTSDRNKTANDDDHHFEENLPDTPPRTTTGIFRLAAPLKAQKTAVNNVAAANNMARKVNARTALNDEQCCSMTSKLTLQLTRSCSFNQ